MSGSSSREVEVSVIMPSLRPQLVQQRIRDYAATSADISYELVVVSPFEVKGANVKHVPEGEPKGTIYATNLGYQHSSGKIIVYTSDDVRPLPHALSNMARFLKRFPAPFVSSFRMLTPDQREREQSSAYDLLYACWGALTRESIEKLGGLFDPIYRSYWADPDLSMRAWTHGGMVRVCPDAWLAFEGAEDDVKSKNMSQSHNQDMEAFLERWHKQFGNGVPPGWPLINRQIPLSAMWYSVEGLLATSKGYLSVPHPAGAEICLQLALERFPNLSSHDETWLQLGKVLHQQGKLEEASRALEKAVEIRPKNGFAWKLLGVNRLLLKNREEAEPALRQALEILSDDGEVMISLGWCLLEKGDFRSAFHLLQQGTEKKPEEIAGWSGLAICAKDQNQKQIFQKAYARACAIDRDHPSLASLHETASR